MKEIKGTNPLDTYAIATGQTPVEGDLAVIDATAKIVEADDVTGVKVVGVIDGIDADGNVYVNSLIVLRANGSISLTRADRGSKCFVVDGVTVAKTGTVVAGTVIDVTSAGVFVDTSPAAMKDVTGAGTHIADVAGVTQAALVLDSMSGSAGVTLAAETNINLLVVSSMTGSAGVTMAAETNMNAIAVNNVGTPSTSTMATVTESGNTGSADLTPVRNNFATLATELATQKALNTVLINDAKTFATELNAQRSLNAVLVNDAKTFATELNAARADNAAQVIKINALIAALEAAGIVKTA